jgi:hypothetical protein
MLLSETEIRRSLELAKEAFPRFRAWQFNNEVSEFHSGFAVWGELVLDKDTMSPRRFFVTFDVYKSGWKGHLSIGKNNYMWSSADFGDACLLDTDSCATLELAISALKHQTAQLFELIAH